MSAKKEGENVHNFPVYQFDGPGDNTLEGNTIKYLTYKDPSKCTSKPLCSGVYEFMLPSFCGELTRDPNIDFWRDSSYVISDIAMGAEYLGIGIIHKDLRK